MQHHEDGVKGVAQEFGTDIVETIVILLDKRVRVTRDSVADNFQWKFFVHSTHLRQPARERGNLAGGRTTFRTRYETMGAREAFPVRDLRRSVAKGFRA